MARFSTDSRPWSTGRRVSISYIYNSSAIRTGLTDYVDFNHPSGALLGVLNASYNLGGLITLPVIPWANDTLGRKHSITLGSIILYIGVALQSSAINSKF